MAGESDDWHETLMAWGARRSGLLVSSRLGFGRTIYDRMMSGLRGTTCSKCIGRGVVTVLITSGEQVTRSRAPCPLCKGKGRINVNTRGLINPATIPSTVRGAPITDEPEIYRRIDLAFWQLVIRHRIVLIVRYVRYPRRKDADERIAAVNEWLDRIGEKPVSKTYLEEKLLPTAKRELYAALYPNG